MSGSVNKVTLLGNICAGPEVRSTQNGTKVANFNLATNESWKDKDTGEKREKAEFHRIVLFGNLADIAGRYLSKGSKVYLEGQLQTRKWQDQSGQDKYTTEVVLQGFGGKMVMLDGKPQGESQGGNWDEPAASGPTNPGLDDEIPF